MAKGDTLFGGAQTGVIPHMMMERTLSLYLRNHIVAKVQNYLLPIQSLDPALGIKQE